jgi:glycosyltransferase involved in cell wall biosynthesis
VSFAGFVDNVYAYMGSASVFVLSSRHEGLPTVLIEAMACGCPVVATDCPSGPREILQDGAYGPLVPVGDETSLAEAILEALDSPVSPELLRERASDFSTESALEEYVEFIRNAPGGS